MANAKVIISSKNEMKQGLKSAESDLKSFEQVAQKVGDSIKKAFAFTAVLASLKKLGSACTDAFKDYETAARKYKQLSLTIGDTKSYDKAVSTINKLSRQTLEGKDSIESMVSELSALGKSADEIDSIASSAVYLSNVTGKDLNTSMQTLLNTYNGNTTALKKLGIDVSNFTKEELEQGKAVEYVKNQFQGLSEEMSKGNASQSLNNIKNTLGDIKQGFGQLFSTAIAPTLNAMDEGLTTFQGRFQGVVDNLTIVIQNFPEVLRRAIELAKKMLNHLFNFEDLKSLFKAFVDGLLMHIKLSIERVHNLLTLAFKTIPDMAKAVFDGVFNYGMGIITGLCDEIGFDLSGLINNIGKWLTDSKVGQFIDTVVTNAVNGVRLVANLIKNIPEMFRIVVNNSSTIISNLWITMKNGFLTALSTITKTLGDVISGINLKQRIETLVVSFRNVFGNLGGGLSAFANTAKDTFRYIGDVIKATFSWDTIKNKALGMIENFCNFFVDAINSLIPDWFEHIPGLRNVKGIERVSLTDGVSSNPYADIKGITKYENTYVDEVPRVIESTVGNFFTNLSKSISGLVTDEKADWSNVSKQFADLLNPVFEKYSQDSSISIGETLATWTAKSSKEYFEQSKKSFSSIGGLVKDWAKDMIGDEVDGWREVINLISTTGESIFGDDIKGFTEWLDGLIADAKANAPLNGSSSVFGNIGSGSTESGSSSNKESAVFPNNPSGVWNWFENSIENPMTESFNDLAGLFDKFGEEMPTWLTVVGNEFMSGVMEWIGALKPLFDIIDNACNPMKMILHIIEGFVNVMGPALTAVFQPLVDLFTSIGETIGKLFLPVLDVLGSIISTISNILGTILLPIIQLLTPLFDILAMALEPLNGLLILLGKGIMVLMAPIQWLGDSLAWIGSWIKYFGKCISEVINHLFDLRNADFSGKPGSFQSDAFTGLADRLANYGVGTDSLATQAYQNSTQQAVQNASYSGGASITVNVTVEGNVVGENGITEFAKIIRSELLELDYYNV